MSVISWARRKIGLTDDWRGIFTDPTWSGEQIDAHCAMQVSAFWACVRLISQTIGTLPIGLYSRDADGGRQPRTDLPLYRILHDQPNADSTAVEFWEAMTACVCVAGNAYAEKATGTRGLIALTLLRPDWMCVDRTPEGRLHYVYKDPKGQREYDEDEIFHIKGFGFGGDEGLSPVTYARQSLGVARAAERAAASVFANGLRPSGWLLYKGGKNLTPEQRDRARKTLIEPMQGAENAGKVGILEGDFDYRQITLQPDDAQLLESRRHSVEEVCQWLGVPPILIGHAAQGQTMWGSGVEQIFIGWLTLGLRPYLTRIEQAIKRSLLLPQERQAGIYAEFNIEGLLRADSSSRGEFYWKLAQLGAITPNQICDRENLPRFEGGDVHLINQTLIPLEKLQLAPDQANAVRSALQAWLNQQPEGPSRPRLEVVK